MHLLIVRVILIVTMHRIRTPKGLITYRISYKAYDKDLDLKSYLCICVLEQCVMFLMRLFVCA